MANDSRVGNGRSGNVGLMDALQWGCTGQLGLRGDDVWGGGKIIHGFIGPSRVVSQHVAYMMLSVFLQDIRPTHFLHRALNPNLFPSDREIPY